MLEDRALPRAPIAFQEHCVVTLQLTLNLVDNRFSAEKNVVPIWSHRLGNKIGAQAQICRDRNLPARSEINRNFLPSIYVSVTSIIDGTVFKLIDGGRCREA